MRRLMMLTACLLIFAPGRAAEETGGEPANAPIPGGMPLETNADGSPLNEDEQRTAILSGTEVKSTTDLGDEEDVDEAEGRRLEEADEDEDE